MRNSYLHKNCAGGRRGGGGGGGERKRDFFLLFHVLFNTMAVFKSGFISRLLHNIRGFKKKKVLTERSENMCSRIIIFETDSTVLCQKLKKRLFHCPLLELAGR